MPVNTWTNTLASQFNDYHLELVNWSVEVEQVTCLRYDLQQPDMEGLYLTVVALFEWSNEIKLHTETNCNKSLSGVEVSSVAYDWHIC